VRIIAGRLRGRALMGPSSLGSGIMSAGLRPSSDRLRETLFNVLAHGLGKHGVDNPVEGAHVLDLFAGTGALAFEALSRGATYAVMVDDGSEARGLQRANVEALGLGGVTRILRRDATKLGVVAPFEPFTLLFCDPPYGKGLGEQALESAMSGGWLAGGAIVVLEERADVKIMLPDQLELLDERITGEGKTLILRSNL
jgi:16S rRNA (guanine966-N2)-methyltransferase